MIFKDTIIYNALGFQYTGNLNNKRYINLSLTAYIKRRFKQIVKNVLLLKINDFQFHLLSNLYDKVPVLVIGDSVIKRGGMWFP
jgi:hypothetical protein